MSSGTVISMPMSGILATSLGWESIFYVFGVIGCVWFIAWTIVVKRSPQEDPFISEGEKNYIVKKIGLCKQEDMPPPPWKAIFTSAAVWAIVASHFSENWGFYTLVRLKNILWIGGLLIVLLFS